MTNFRSEYPAFTFPFQISHQSSTLCMGSCFAEHIGQRLSRYHFPVLVNPFGILYQPVSIAGQLERALQQEPYLDSELFEQQGLWHHFQFHSRFSGSVQEQVLAQMNEQLRLCRSSLLQSGQLIITLGTARVFKTKDNQEVVANCHKLPAGHFDRSLLSVADCVSVLSSAFAKIKAVNPNLNIILTVSPVRHIRDGLHENQLSKATLLLACADISQQLDYVHYFPSWEIMMDDLRDYRFYEADLIHPNSMAIDYIWSYFSNSVFTKETQHLVLQIEKIVQATLHRPFQVASEAHQLFLRKQLEEINDLEKRFSFLTMEREKRVLEGQVV
jgi:GSCFA family